MLLMNKAVNLILLEQEDHGNDILRQLYNRQQDEIYKEMINTFLNKTKKEIIESFMQRD